MTTCIFTTSARAVHLVIRCLVVSYELTVIGCAPRQPSCYSSYEDLGSSIQARGQWIPEGHSGSDRDCYLLHVRGLDTPSPTFLISSAGVITGNVMAVNMSVDYAIDTANSEYVRTKPLGAVRRVVTVDRRSGETTMTEVSGTTTLRYKLSRSPQQ
jgi:hypothetical protein